MKTSPLTSFSFLLLVFSTKFLLSSSASYVEVIDIYNETVTSGRNYYIVDRSDNFTLNFFPGMDSVSCPHDVIKQQTTGNLAYISPTSGSTTVKESTNLNVRFRKAIDYCKETEFPLWKAGNESASVEGKRPILASGNFNAEDPDTWFRIKSVGFNKGELEYIFVHCTSDCDCNDVGYTFEGGANRLTIAPTRARYLTLPVVFVPEEPEIIKLVTNN